MIKTTQENKRVRFIAFYLFIFFFSIYLLTAAGLNFFHMDASILRIQVTKSIVDGSDLSVSDGLRGTDGKYYSWMGIGSSLLAVPFYLLGKLTGRPEITISIMNQFTSAATVVLVFLFTITLGYSNRTSIFISVFYGLGTIAWPLSKHPFDYPIATFFILLAIYFMYLYVAGKKSSYLMISAVSFGVAFITRTNSILALPSIFLLMIISLLKCPDFKATVKLTLRNVILFSIAFLPFLGIFFWYNHYRFGSIFETGYQLMAQRLGFDLFSGTTFLTGLSGLLMSPGKGFFYYSPIAILFFFTIGYFSKKHLEIALCFICLILTYILFHSNYMFWHGDWAWGPRHISMITPFLMIPLAELFSSNAWIKIKLLRAIVYSIFIFSFIIQIAAVSVDFQKYFNDLRIENKVKFTETYRDGVIPFIQPPLNTYFDWHKSPIRAQFKFIYKMATGIKDYRYSKLPNNASKAEKIMASPYMNVFDFWWLYEYFLYGSYWGFIAALLLLLTALYSCSRLCKPVNFR